MENSVNNAQIAEAVWQADSKGLKAQLDQAKQLEIEKQYVNAHCLFATAYYSHFASHLPRHPLRAFAEFKKAKYFAKIASRWMQGVEQFTTHSQCDVIGTILLRGWLWQEADASNAIRFLKVGLNQENVPAHSKALMIMGLAEGSYLLSLTSNIPMLHVADCKMYILTACQLELVIGTEEDFVHAQRQFTRVLRRAFRLYYLLGDKKQAEDLYEQAFKNARNPMWKSEDQIRKIEMEWKILHLPWFIRALLPQ